MQNKTKTLKYILGALQMQRGIAAVLVVISHAVLTMLEKVGLPENYATKAYWIGQIGVANFFVISGFIIFESHYNDFGSRHAVSNFILKRLGRIVPLYWITIAILLIKMVLSGEFAARGLALGHVILSFLFVPFQLPGAAHFGSPVYGVGWTLEYEMFFYAAFASVISITRKNIALVILFVTFSVFCILHASNFFYKDTLFWYFSSSFIMYFLVGIYISVLRQFFQSRYYFELNSYVSNFLCIFILLIFLLVFSSGAIICATAMVAICAFTRRVDTASPLAIDTFGVWLGGLTYSIYLTHSFFLGPWGRLVGKFDPNRFVGSFVTLGLLGSIVLGHFCVIYVEQPLLRWWRKTILRSSVSSKDVVATFT